MSFIKFVFTIVLSFLFYVGFIVFFLFLDSSLFDSSIGKLGSTILGTFVFLSAIILLSAFNSPIPRKIGFRNITRRVSNTVLVVIGSMVGAALISGSLVLSDSLDKTFYNLVGDQVAELDVMLSVKDKQLATSPISFIDGFEYKQVEKVLNVEEVDNIMPVTFLQVTPQKLDRYGNPVINQYGVTLHAVEIEKYNSFFKEGAVELDEFKSPNGIYITDYLAERLELEKGDSIRVPLGIINIDFKVEKIYKRGDIPSDPVIIANQEYINQRLMLPQGSSTNIFVSAQGGIEPDDYDGEKFEELVQERLEGFSSQRIEFTTFEAKQQALDGFGMKIFANIFLVMSLFGIFAGMLLIVNLYSMLAAERKYEMGIMRAIALTRFQLTKTFIYEGYLYSILSSLLGTFIGIGIGYFLVISLDSMIGRIFETIGQDDIFKIAFDVNPDSLVLAFSAGSIITIITAAFSSFRISRLNIVSAIRNTQEEIIHKYNFKWLFSTLLLLLLTGMSLISLLAFFGVKDSFEQSRDSGEGYFADLSETKFEELVNVTQSYLLYVGVVFTLIFGSFLFNRLLKIVTKFDLTRYTITLASLITIIFTSTLSKFDSYIKAGESEYSIALFFMSGITLVISMSLIFTYNLDLIIKALTFILSPIRGLSSILKISLRYPSVNRARTGLTLIMFALVIFLIVYTSMMKVTMRQVNQNTLEETLGGYEVLVIPSLNLGLSDRDQLLNDAESIDDVEEVTQLVHTTVIMPEYKYEDLDDAPVYDNPFLYQYNEDDYFETVLDGLPEDFIEKQDIRLAEFLDKYEDREQVWDTVISDHSKVVIGSAFTEEGFGKRPELRLGDRVRISDKFNQDTREVEIIALAETQGGMGGFYSSLITTDNAIDATLSSDYIDNSSESEILVGFKEGVNESESIKELKKKLISYDILQILELNELTATIQSIMDSMILMFQAFLGFSLIVGASGLAIIVARSVQERRQQIGMLRSLGFQRRMILIGFFIEATFITFLGIVTGISMGTIGALNQFYIEFHDQPDIKPVIAYEEVFIISMIVYAASIIFSIWPAIKASRLSPVEATNYPE